MVESLCFRVLQILRESACSFSVTFVGPRRIRLLNRRYRGKDYPADVLTFRYPGESLEGQPFLGEILISPEVASRNARQWNATLQREVRRLLIHGVLHLLGYDHETDKGEMRRLENRLMRSRARIRSGPVGRARYAG